jgi:twinfilin-like protein
VRSQKRSKSQANVVAPDLQATIYEAFADFCLNRDLLALPLALHDGSLEPLLPVHSSTSFQVALNELSTVLNPRIALYILLRRNDTLTAITFVPYLAKDNQRGFFLDHRHELVQKLGKEHFSQSLICKEIGEITDVRSWTERDDNNASNETAADHPKDAEVCQDDACEACTVQDMGYKRNKCRLCDRRMQNKISPEALEALKGLSTPGTVVQIVSLSIFSQSKIIN